MEDSDVFKRKTVKKNITTKRFITFTLLILLITGTRLMACDIHFSVQGEQKVSYAKDEVIVILVKVVFTHRICTEGIEATKCTGDGMQVLRATKWVETSTGVWERKLQVKITGNKTGKLKITAKRTCDKEGGFAGIYLKQA